MMGVAEIIAANEAAARAAKGAGTQPALAEQDGVIPHLPMVSNYLPKGWKRVKLFPQPVGVPYYRGFDPYGNCGYGAWFVDKTGMGRTDELALTIEEFATKVKAGYGYAVVEDGQFQALVGVFKHD